MDLGVPPLSLGFSTKTLGLRSSGYISGLSERLRSENKLTGGFFSRLNTCKARLSLKIIFALGKGISLNF